MKPDAAFRQSQGGGDGTTLAKALGGKYLEGIGDDSDLASLAGLCQVSTLTSSIPTNLVKGKPVTADGQTALPLASPDGDGTLYVTDTTASRVIRVVNTTKGDSGHADITYAPVTFTAPTSDETIIV